MTRAPAIAPDDARQILISGAACIVSSQVCALEQAAGHILAHDIIATDNLPATANAAVDGYAVHAEFLADTPGHSFTVIGRAAAGHPFDGTVKRGEAVRIFTGAIMPDGPDAVAMHEDCVFDEAEGSVKINTQLKPGANRRPAGENISTGEMIIPAGKRLGPADLGIAAAAGHAQLEVRKQLKVGLMSMGDEIRDAGSVIDFGQSFDSNRPMLRALIEADGHRVVDYGIINDDADALSQAYGTALADCDVVLSSAGASDGDEDHTQRAMQALGVSLIFWRLAMKPGRPMAVGSFNDKRVFCLPGNPVAAFVCYRLLAAPVLGIMAGGMISKPLRPLVRCAFDHRKSAGRAEYLRVRLDEGADQVPEMHLHGRRGAGVLSSLTGADGLVEVPLENTGVAEGDYLRFIPFREAGL